MSSTATNRLHNDRKYQQTSIDFMHVLPLLACSPIAELTMEAFYTQNKFSTCFHPSAGVLKLPKQCRSLIRHVELILMLGPPPFLVVLTEFDKLKLKNLHALDLKITSTNSLHQSPEAREEVVEHIKTLQPIQLSTRKLLRKMM